MPFVYIHGVRQRSEAALGRLSTQLRTTLDTLHFDELDAGHYQIRTPFWGKFGVEPRYDDRILPFRSGTADSTRSQGGPQQQTVAGESDALELLRVATHGDRAAMEKLIREQAEANLSDEERDEIEQVLRADWQAVYREGQEEALHKGVQELDGLRSGPNAGGGIVRKRKLPQRLADMVERAASTVALTSPTITDWLRKSHYDMSQFLGDAMKYVQHRERYLAKQSAPILATVLEALPTHEQDGDPLIVMTHSMGGSIFYDILTTILTELKVSCWISVGSQVSQFQSLGLLAQAEPSYDSNGLINDVAPRVKRWFNVYDPLDFLNYRASGVFSKVVDREFRTARGPTGSHSGYFREQDFYDQVGEMIAEALGAHE